MLVEFTYEVVVTVDEDKGTDVEKALLVTAKEFDRTGASVTETDAVEQEDGSALDETE